LGGEKGWGGVGGRIGCGGSGGGGGGEGGSDALHRITGRPSGIDLARKPKKHEA
jgi:hypothetical protein